MDITFISDTHDLHDRLKLIPGAVLIHAGDITEFGTEEEVTDFLYWFSRQPFTYKIFIAGNHDLFGLLHAINNHLQDRFTYHKFWEDQRTHRTVEPLALKEFKNRWYLLARDLNPETSVGTIKTFGLDRLTALDITRNQFKKPAKFDIEEQFRYCFGIISPSDEEPQEVILSFDPVQGKYIKSLPLHESQQILVDNATELKIKLLLYVTYDFVMELLSYGEFVKVLKPDTLIGEMKSRYSKSLANYRVKA